MTTAKVSPSVLIGPDLADGAEVRVDELILRQALANPDAPAVRWRGADLSYRDLVGQAERVAEALRGIGIGRGEIVAVRLARGPELIVTLLGVLLLGSAYTAIPPEWPVPRAVDVVRRTGASVCVTDGTALPDVGTVVVERDRLLSGTAQPVLTPRGAGLPEGACCVFFTSGSTGVPKCVLSPHGGVARVAFDPRLEFGCDTVMLQSASLAWDGFSFEVWCPLVNGGCVVPRESEFFSFDDIRAAVAQGVNTVFLTPTLFNATVTDDMEALRGIRAVMLGGEAVSVKHTGLALRRFPELAVFNLYGPVEATMCLTGYRVTGAETGEVPIGTPLAETGVWLLDENQRPVATGDVGEIAVSGAGVAFGYLGDDLETTRRFRRLPLGPDGAEVRVYLTGDVGVLDTNGDVLFRGRQDRQVKVQGVRVEPGEVERVIGTVPGVGSVIVLPTPPGASSPTGLAALYTSSEAVDEQRIRAAVHAELPAAFVPNLLRRVAALPVTDTGKVDERRVAELLGAEAQPDPQGESPLELVLRHLTDLLGERPAADADIFELGATSISALNLARRIGKPFGVKIPVSAVLRGRTPNVIAAQLESVLRARTC
ncbi:MAG TPA: non-ribosomal peptide synthetase [Pseudonocardiaceae bacterium]